MRWLLLLAILLLAGCQSKRNLIAREHSVETVQTAVSADETHTCSRNTWSKILATCDSMGLTLTADSIRTPDGGMIYSPVITVNAVAPSVAAESTANETETDTLHIDAQQTADTSIDVESNDSRDTVAVAKPPSLRAIYTLAVITALGWFIIRAIRSRI